MAQDIPFGVGVLVIKDGRILCGIRGDNYQICGPGGHIQMGEAPIDAAYRETTEEFGIKPLNMTPFGVVSDADEAFRPAFEYICTIYEGEPKVDGKEMLQWAYASVQELLEAEDVYPVFRASIEKLQKHFKGGSDDTEEPATV